MTAARKLPEPTLLALDKIRLDGGTQSRAQLDEGTIADYAEVIAALPPVDVFFDGETYWLADGFHRHGAFVRAGRKKIDCIVHQGTQRDAVLFSVGANDAHGLRRSNADKRRAVMLLLKDEEWGRKSDRWIAEKCGVGHQLVGSIRIQVDDSSTSKRTGKDGKQYAASKPSAAPAKTAARAVIPAPKVEQCPHHGCKFEPGERCPVCAHREAKGLPNGTPAPSPPPSPAPGKWECADCHSWWPGDVDLCAECERAANEETAPAEDCDEDETAFEALRAVSLESLIAQRNADPDFAGFLQVQRMMAAAAPNRGLRMAIFALDGGELALLRLGLDWNVNADSLKRAYRIVAAQAHPDRGGSTAEFAAVTAARDLIQRGLL